MRFIWKHRSTASVVYFRGDGRCVQAGHGAQRRLPRNKNRQKPPQARSVWTSDHAGRRGRHVYGLLRHIQDKLAKKVSAAYPVTSDIISMFRVHGKVTVNQLHLCVPRELIICLHFNSLCTNFYELTIHASKKLTILTVCVSW